MTAIAGRRQGDGRRPASALPMLAFARKELSGILGNPLHVDHSFVRGLACSRDGRAPAGTARPRLRACTPGGCEPADRGDHRWWRSVPGAVSREYRLRGDQRVTRW